MGSGVEAFVGLQRGLQAAMSSCSDEAPAVVRRSLVDVPAVIVAHEHPVDDAVAGP